MCLSRICIGINGNGKLSGIKHLFRYFGFVLNNLLGYIGSTPKPYSGTDDFIAIRDYDRLGLVLSLPALLISKVYHISVLYKCSSLIII